MSQEEQEDILETALRITKGDRNAQYGPPDQDFQRTAVMWSALKGVHFEAREVAMFMICIKLSRETHQMKLDNWVDMAGYARCGSLCKPSKEKTDDSPVSGPLPRPERPVVASGADSAASGATLGVEPAEPVQTVPAGGPELPPPGRAVKDFVDSLRAYWADVVPESLREPADGSREPREPVQTMPASVQLSTIRHILMKVRSDMDNCLLMHPDFPEHWNFTDQVKQRLKVIAVHLQEKRKEWTEQVRTIIELIGEEE